MNRTLPQLVPDPAPSEERGVSHERGEDQLLSAHPTWDPVRDASSRIAAAMLDASDPSTAQHSDDVELLAAEICRRLEVPAAEREHVLVAARLHDVGKVAMPREVLEKPGPLDHEERLLMKSHTLLGERILRSIAELHTAARLVRHSHEHFDGSGYPDALQGEEIPLGSRIILCADAYHAIRSDRFYRRGRSTAEALSEMRACAGTQFDPAVVEALSSTIAEAGTGRLRRRIPRRLLVLITTLTIGASGAYAAERGWIDSPLPGIGGEHATEADEPPPKAVEPTAAREPRSKAEKDDEGNRSPESGSANGNGRGGSPRAGSPGIGRSASGKGVGKGSGQSLRPGGAGSGAGPSATSPSSGSEGSNLGNSGPAAGQSGSSPGNSSYAPGQTGQTPSDSSSAPGHSGNLPGYLGPLPNQPGISPGKNDSTPGGSGDLPNDLGAVPGAGKSRSGAAAPGGNSAASGTHRSK